MFLVCKNISGPKHSILYRPSGCYFDHLLSLVASKKNSQFFFAKILIFSDTIADIFFLSPDTYRCSKIDMTNSVSQSINV